MFYIKDPQQTNSLDPWEHLGPKRKKLLEDSWAGLFREEILPILPVEILEEYYSKNEGRPTKELYSLLGMMVLQESFNLSDQETLQQFAFNLQWQYALNITEDNDAAAYLCEKTVWSMRKIFLGQGLASSVFEEVTQCLEDSFGVNCDQQRLDSVHIQSNMRRLGRIGIFSKTIRKFLTNLKREHRVLFDELPKNYATTCLGEAREGLPVSFSMVKPNDSKKSLHDLSKDLYDLVQRFAGNHQVTSMTSYQQLRRVLKEQCNLKESDEGKVEVEVKPPKEIPSDSLQNPSDPEASYDGHKGQGYQVQVMETYSENKSDKVLNLITHIDVEPAHYSDANAVLEAIESASEKGLKPKEVMADTLYGSDENVLAAKKEGVELIAPTMGTLDQEKLHLEDFLDEAGEIKTCPKGQTPQAEKKKENSDRRSLSFDSTVCSTCPLQEKCPVKPGKNFHYLRFNEKELRLARRRSEQKKPEFLEKYRFRSGVEATMSEFDRVTGVKQLRVRGYEAVRHAAILKATGVNIFRATAVRKALKKGIFLFLRKFWTYIGKITLLIVNFKDF